MNELKNNIEESNGKKIKRTGIYVLLIIFSVVLVFVLFRSKEVGNAIASLMSVFTPIFFGIAIAYILNPTVTFFTNLYITVAKKVFNSKSNKLEKRAKNVSILISIIILFFLLSVLISSVLPQLYQTIMSLIGYVPSAIDKIEELYNNLSHNDSKFLETLNISVSDILSNIENWFTNNLSAAVNSALQHIANGVMSAFSFITNFIIGICVALYLLKEKNTLFAHMKKIIYALFNKKRADSFIKTGKHAKKIFNGYIYGNIVGCLIVFVATFVFMMIMRMPYVLLISTIVCLTNFIPFFGPVIGAVPSILILLLHDPMMALSFTIFTLVLQQIEGHFLTPLIISDTTGVSPFWVTVALLLGAGLFGLMGLIFAVPVFSVIYYIIKTSVEKKLVDKSLPTRTSEYAVEDNFQVVLSERESAKGYIHNVENTNPEKVQENEEKMKKVRAMKNKK